MKFYETEDEFSLYYVLKVFTESGEQYFFRPNVYVKSVGLARKFNTLRSVKRSIRLCNLKQFTIETYKRDS